MSVRLQWNGTQRTYDVLSWRRSPAAENLLEAGCRHSENPTQRLLASSSMDGQDVIGNHCGTSGEETGGVTARLSQSSSAVGAHVWAANNSCRAGCFPGVHLSVHRPSSTAAAAPRAVAVHPTNPHRRRGSSVPAKASAGSPPAVWMPSLPVTPKLPVVSLEVLCYVWIRIYVRYGMVWQGKVASY